MVRSVSKRGPQARATRWRRSGLARDLWDENDSIRARALVEVAVADFHYATKADLLLEISKIGHRAVLPEVETAVEAETATIARMRAFVVAFARWHAEHHTVARIIQYELAGFPPDGPAAIRGCAARSRRCSTPASSPVILTRPILRRPPGAVLSLGIDVARWYRPERAERPQVIGDYGDLVLRMLRPGTA